MDITIDGTCGNNLTWTLTLPDGLLVINGEGEMEGFERDSRSIKKNKIKKVEIAHGITSIEDWAFSGCKALTSIKIPDSVTSIGSNAFDGCKALTSIEIPNSVTSIGYGAFYDCEALTSIEIPDSVTEIGDDAFCGCEALQYNEYGNGCYLGSKGNPYAFFIMPKPYNTTSCLINKSCKVIAMETFEEYDALTNITVDEDNHNYSSIDGVLYDKRKKVLIACPRIKTSVKIPDSVTEIKDSAFGKCELLTEITIPQGVTKIGDCAFSVCINLKHIELPNSIIEIKDNAFEECEALTSIEIPNSVTSIGDYAFAWCKALANINVAEGNANYASVNGVLFDKEKKTLIQCPGAKTNIEIPKSVTKFEHYAFLDNNTLRSIHIRCYHPEDMEMTDMDFNDEIYENCTLYIPAGSEDAYKYHPVFSKFKEVIIEK